MRKLVLGLVFAAAWLAASGAGIREGMSRQQVEANLGQPVSFLTRGEATVLHYPDRGRVELVADRVVRMSHVRHADDPPAQKEAAAIESARQAEIAIAKKAAEEATVAAEWEVSNTEAQKHLDSAIEQLSADHAADRVTEDLGLFVEPSHFWIELVVSLLVQVGVGMIVLKMAFAWTDVHADWGQMFLPSLAAAASGALVRGGAYALWRTDQLFHLDHAVSYAVLLFTLLKATHACTWQRAAGVAMASKLMSMIVWVFLSVALTRALFA